MFTVLLSNFLYNFKVAISQAQIPCPPGGIKEEKHIFILNYIHFENFEAYLMIGKCVLG